MGEEYVLRRYSRVLKRHVYVGTKGATMSAKSARLFPSLEAARQWQESIHRRALRLMRGATKRQVEANAAIVREYEAVPLSEVLMDLADERR